MSSSTTSSNATAARLPSFERRMQDVKLSKAHINAVVMDYLVREGYPRAAQRFAAEANIQSDLDIDSINNRVEIRNLIYAGKIEDAISRINELNPQILDGDEALHFSLMRLQLVELIRVSIAKGLEGDIGPPIEFATTHLAPRAPTRPEFLNDLEQTMTLLILSPDNVSEHPHLAALLDPQLRKDVAHKVNEAILESQGEHSRSKLLYLVKARIWAEYRARESKKDIPEHLDIGLEFLGGNNGNTAAGSSGGNATGGVGVGTGQTGTAIAGSPADATMAQEHFTGQDNEEHTDTSTLDVTEARSQQTASQGALQPRPLSPQHQDSSYAGYRRAMQAIPSAMPRHLCNCQRTTCVQARLDWYSSISRALAHPDSPPGASRVLFDGALSVLNRPPFHEPDHPQNSGNPQIWEIQQQTMEPLHQVWAEEDQEMEALFQASDEEAYQYSLEAYPEASDEHDQDLEADP